MKRLAAFLYLTFLAWSAGPVLPAGANTVAVAIDCDAVTVTYAAFPERPVDLHVLVGLDGDPVLDTTVSTDGARSGEIVVPVEFTTGTAEATVRWTLRDREHVAGPVTAALDCDTTSTTEPPTTTTQPESTTTIPATSSPPTTAPTNDECPDGGLACTGTSSMTVPLVLGTLVAVGAGIAMIVGPKLRERRRTLPR